MNLTGKELGRGTVNGCTSLAIPAFLDETKDNRGAVSIPDGGAQCAATLARARHRCEGSPAFPACRAANHQPHPETGSRVVLTIAHLDHDPTHNEPDNLRAWCQRCHVTFDALHHASTASRTRKKALEQAGQLTLF